MIIFQLASSIIIKICSAIKIKNILGLFNADHYFKGYIRRFYASAAVRLDCAKKITT